MAALPPAYALPTPGAPPGAPDGAALPMGAALPVAAPLIAPKRFASAGSTTKLDVGGRVFRVADSTLRACAFFAPVLDGEVEADGPDGSFFIDADPDVFAVALAHLRDGPDGVPESFSDWKALRVMATRLGLAALGTWCAARANWGNAEDHATLALPQNGRGKPFVTQQCTYVLPLSVRNIADGTRVPSETDVIGLMAAEGWRCVASEHQQTLGPGMTGVVHSRELRFSRPCYLRAEDAEENQLPEAADSVASAGGAGPDAVEASFTWQAGLPFNNGAPKFLYEGPHGSMVFKNFLNGVHDVQGCDFGDEIVAIEGVSVADFAAKSPQALQVAESLTQQMQASGSVRVRVVAVPFVPRR